MNDLPIIVQQMKLDIAGYRKPLTEAAKLAQTFGAKSGQFVSAGLDKIEKQLDRLGKRVSSTEKLWAHYGDEAVKQAKRIESAFQKLEQRARGRATLHPSARQIDLVQQMYGVRSRRGSMRDLFRGEAAGVMAPKDQAQIDREISKRMEENARRLLRQNRQQKEFLRNLRTGSTASVGGLPLGATSDRRTRFLQDLHRNMAATVGGYPVGATSDVRKRYLQDLRDRSTGMVGSYPVGATSDRRTKFLQDLKEASNKKNAQDEFLKNLRFNTEKEAFDKRVAAYRTPGQRWFGKDSWFGMGGRHSLKDRLDAQGYLGFAGRLGIAGVGGASAGGTAGFYAGRSAGGGGISGLIGGLAGGAGGMGGGGIGAMLGFAAGGPGGALVGGGIGSSIGAMVGTIVGSAAKVLEGILESIADAAMKAAGHLRDFLGHLVEAGMRAEKAQAVFGGLLGGTEKGKDFYTALQHRSQQTPFSVEQLSDVSKTLLGMGVKLEEMDSYLNVMGNLAGGDPDRLKRLAFTIGETMAEGVLTGQRMRQFATLGIGVEDFAKTMGITPAEFKQRQHSNDIGAGVAQATVNRLVAPGGRFHENLARGLDTTKGQYERFTGIMNTLAENTGKALINVRGLKEGMKGINDWLITLEPQLVKLSERFGEMTTGFLSAFREMMPGKGGAGGVLQMFQQMMPTETQAKEFGKNLIDASREAGMAILSMADDVINAIKEIRRVATVGKNVADGVSKAMEYTPAGIMWKSLGALVGRIGEITGVTKRVPQGGGHPLGNAIRGALGIAGQMVMGPEIEKSDLAGAFKKGWEAVEAAAAKGIPAAGPGGAFGGMVGDWLTGQVRRQASAQPKPLAATVANLAPGIGGGIGGLFGAGGFGQALGGLLGAGMNGRLNIRPPNPPSNILEAQEWQRRIFGTPEVREDLGKGRKGVVTSAAVPGEGFTAAQQFMAKMNTGAAAFANAPQARALWNYQNFKQLQGATIGEVTPADRLVSASVIGSTEAQDDLNKASTQNMTTQEQVLQTLQAALDIHKQTMDAVEKSKELLEKLPQEFKDKVGMVVMPGDKR